MYKFQHFGLLQVVSAEMSSGYWWKFSCTTQNAHMVKLEEDTWETCSDNNLEKE